MPIYFQRLAETDLPVLTAWLERPHVAAWWDACHSLEEARAKYLPRVAGESAAVPYFAYLDAVPIGYIQSYVAIDRGDGWWTDQQDLGVCGIDQFLAEERALGKGLGTQMVREFVHFLFRDPMVRRIQADPSPGNPRAIRCYEKAGFRSLGIIATPDGAAVLVALDRSDHKL